MDLNIRVAFSADFTALIQCDEDAQDNGARREHLAAAVTQGTCILARDSANTSGFVILEHSFFGFGFVSAVCVAPAARRRGVAKRLLRAAESVCTTSKLFASTNQSNAAAQALMLQAGFEPSGIIQNLDVDDPELIFFTRVNGG